MKWLGWARASSPCRAAVALAVLAFAAGCSRSEEPASKAARTGRPPVPVAVAAARGAEVPVELHAIGTVTAFSKVSIKSRLAGQLMRAAFKEGDHVQSGQMIFTIDPRPFQAALEQTQANMRKDEALLVKAKADMRRAEELAKTRVISAATLDQNRAAVDSLVAAVASDKAAVENARLQLSYCYIHSPIEGRIGTLLVNEGNMIKENETVMAVINQIRPIYVDFSVPERHLGEIRDRMARGPLKVVAAVPGDTSRRAEGELAVVNNTVDASTGTIMLRAQFPNQDEALWPGQFVNVTLRLRTIPHAVLVPSQAVQPGQEGQYVFVVKPDLTAEMRPVVTGQAHGQDVIVENGLRAGERVVTTGQLRLVNNSKVQIKEEEKGKATAAKPQAAP
ncbi:MAG: efflux RND transporter periplasmic adaptor subunit [Candidatus Tectomicrobia bacterium]|uniref:Efflux RND transporter periplasmic adaptor subunit n=1 Tax=Tectimicrobiota bacterium TaxID=2528274 RepID=A0A932HYD5_UNCTE|nr:efflux RND transporter periplasmic adaptor subunit [Candidatus Tectomicrobia bacterium]